MGADYYDNMLYTELVPRDLKFEAYCFASAFEHKLMHTYAQTKSLGSWTDLVVTPLRPASENLGLCQFVFEATDGVDSARLSEISLNTANEIVRANMTLMGADDFHQGMAWVLSDLREKTGASYCRILLLDHDKRETEMFSQSVDGRVGDDVFAETHIPYTVALSLNEMIEQDGVVLIRDEHDFDYLSERNPAWVEMLRARGVRNLLLFPLRRKGPLLGYVYVVDFDLGHLGEVKELLELMSFVLGSEVSNHLLLERLKQLSRVDVLTGLLNRRAMIRRVNRIRSEGGKPFGIINLDLNGLKIVNDRDGHDAGDRLLIQSAEVLRKVFYEEDVFRTGGDEFVVLVDDIDRDVFYRKLSRLREVLAKEETVSFAIGSFWSNGSVDVRHAFLRADEGMYADKRVFYAEHPDLRRN